MSKILLLGGTGAMGKYLVDELALKGDEVFVTSRHSHEGREHVEYIVGDAHRLAFVRETIERVKPDAIVDFMVYSTPEFVDRYKFFLGAVKHYIFLSSYRVFAGNSPLDENSPRLLDVIQDEEYLMTDEYGLSKAREENLLRNSGCSNWTIVRPSITYSKSRFQFGCLEAGIVCYRALQGLPVVMPKEMLDKQATLTWAGDVARMLSRLILNPDAMGEDFNVVTSEHRTWREIAEIYRKEIGLRVKEVSLEDYLGVCSKYQTIYDRMFDRVMDNRKVLRVTGLNASDLTPIEVGLAHELSEFKERPSYQYGVDIGASGMLDRLCGSHTCLMGMTLKQKLMYYMSRYRIVGLAYKVANVLRKG